VKVSSSTFRRIVLPYLWSIGFWLAFSILMSLQQEFNNGRRSNSRIDYWTLLLVMATRYLSCAPLTPPIFYLVRRFAINRSNPLRGILVYVFGVVPFVISYVCIRWVIAAPWDVALQRFVPRSLHGFVIVLYGSIGHQVSMYITIVIAAHAYEYFERGRIEELERSELQQALAASELQVLKNQLHPHLLFNTLHSITTLIDSDKVLAKAMVLQLSNLLRTALHHGSSDLVRLREEVKLVEAYLDIEKMRLGTRLEVRWKLDGDTRDVLVPQLVLQPLVENAILHGIACCREGGWLEIASRKIGELIELRIQNTVGGKRTGGMGVGQKNTEARLKHLYSGKATFSFALTEDHLATVTLVFPAFESYQHISTDVSTLGTKAQYR
jgi:signal transduction histidine kinase